MSPFFVSRISTVVFVMIIVTHISLPFSIILYNSYLRSPTSVALLMYISSVQRQD